MPSPFFDETTFRRDLLQGRELERRLGDVFATPDDVRMLASEGGLDASAIDFTSSARAAWAATA